MHESVRRLSHQTCVKASAGRLSEGIAEDTLTESDVGCATNYADRIDVGTADDAAGCSCADPTRSSVSRLAVVGGFAGDPASCQRQGTDVAHIHAQ